MAWIKTQPSLPKLTSTSTALPATQQTPRSTGSSLTGQKWASAIEISERDTMLMAPQCSRLPATVGWATVMLESTLVRLIQHRVESTGRTSPSSSIVSLKVYRNCDKNLVNFTLMLELLLFQIHHQHQAVHLHLRLNRTALLLNGTRINALEATPSRASPYNTLRRISILSSHSLAFFGTSEISMQL